MLHKYREYLFSGPMKVPCTYAILCPMFLIPGNNIMFLINMGGRVLCREGGALGLPPPLPRNLKIIMS